MVPNSSGLKIGGHEHGEQIFEANKNILDSKVSEIEKKKKLNSYHENDIVNAFPLLSKEERLKLYKIMGTKKTGAGSSYRKSMPATDGTGNFSINEVPLSVYTDEVKDFFKDSDIAICSILRKGGVEAKKILDDIDNTIKVVRKLEDKDKRTISLNVSFKNGVSMIDMRNYFDHAIKITDDTSKKDKFNHGYGMKSISNIAEKYHGDFQSKAEDDIFIVKSSSLKFDFMNSSINDG